MECPIVTESLMPLESMDSIEAQQQTTLAPIDIFTTPLTTCVSSPYSNDNNQVDVNKAMAGQKDPNLAWMSDPETFNAVESITTGGVIPTTVQPLLVPTASPSGTTSPIKPGSTLNYIPEDDMSEGTITSPPSPTSSIGTCSDGGSGSDGTYDPPSPFFINDQTYIIRKTKSQSKLFIHITHGGCLYVKYSNVNIFSEVLVSAMCLLFTLLFLFQDAQLEPIHNFGNFS